MTEALKVEAKKPLKEGFLVKKVHKCVRHAWSDSYLVNNALIVGILLSYTLKITRFKYLVHMHTHAQIITL